MGGFVLCSHHCYKWLLDLWIIPQKSTSLHYKFTLNILDEELWVNVQPLTITIIVSIYFNILTGLKTKKECVQQRKL